MNAKEELVRLLMESYGRGVNDAKQEALVALEQIVAAVRTEENEACALIADEAEPYKAADLIRKRMKK